MEYPELTKLEEWFANTTKLRFADDMTFTQGANTIQEQVAEFKKLKSRAGLVELLESQRGCSLEDYNNAAVAATKLSTILEELLQFGDNLTKGQRAIIRIALDKYQPTKEIYGDHI